MGMMSYLEGILEEIAAEEGQDERNGGVMANEGPREKASGIEGNDNDQEKYAIERNLLPATSDVKEAHKKCNEEEAVAEPAEVKEDFPAEGIKDVDKDIGRQM